MANPDTLFVSDHILEQLATVLYDEVNAGSFVGLYANDVPGDPEQALVDFTSPVLPGLDAKDVTGLWQEPVREEPGVWMIRTEILTFAVEEGGEGEGEDGQLIQGLLVSKGFGVVAAGRLPGGPVLLELGGDPLRLRVELYQYASMVYAAIVLA